MNNLGSTVKLLDYKQTRASNDFVPHPPTLVSSGWDSIHLELHQQPKFSTLEHQHNMHVIALSVADTPALGKRSLDGKKQAERRSQGDIAVIPAGIAHSCHWNTSGEFGILAVEPFVLQQVGQDLVDCDRIELIPRFMNESDALLQGIFASLKEEDIQAVLTYLKSRTDVQPDRIGVTGFCFGGSMAFYAATRYSSEITVAASFYGVVIDEWLEHRFSNRKLSSACFGSK